MENIYAFHGTYFTYQNRDIFLNDRTFLLDGRLDERRVKEYAYVYNDLRELLKAVNERGRVEKGIAGGAEQSMKGSGGGTGRTMEDSGGAEQSMKGSGNGGGIAQTVGCGITVYIAPYVYWVDSPDGEEILRPAEGCREPYGMVIDCDSLKLIGLAEHPEEIILAGNRGQSHGAYGNYTLFYFRVRNLELSGLTMGNYCSVDLNYPFDPSLSRRRRTNTITQAQLAGQSGDKLLARNCRFVGRLNLCPVCGGERCLYYRCHFESTDDALNGRAVYVECDFDFYGSRPLYDTKGSGAVFLGCLFRGRTKGDGIEGKQYFTKENGPVTVVSCEYQRELGKIEETGNARKAGEIRKTDGTGEIEKLEGIGKTEKSKEADGQASRMGWTRYPLPSLKCYQYEMKVKEGLEGCESSGRFIVVGGEAAPETVSMEGKEVLNGYRLETGQGTVYNTFNLLRGMDDWDPMGVKDIVLRTGKDRIPTLLAVEAAGRYYNADEMCGQDCGSDKMCRRNYDYDGAFGQDCNSAITSKERIISGEPGILLRAQAFYFYGERAEHVKISYEVSEGDKAYVRLTDYGDGTCLAEGCSEEKAERRVLIHAVTPQGLEAAVELTIWPRLRAAPEFLERPGIVQEDAGSSRLCYQLDLGEYEDRSVIFWYRCEDAAGRNPILTAVSRGNVPMREYPLTDGDAGYYLMAGIIPCHVCSRQGEMVKVISERKIVREDILEKILGSGKDRRRILIDTDFSHMPAVRQEKILPGFWTVDAARPVDTADVSGWTEGNTDTENPWKYGRTGNGSIGYGLYQNVQGARLRYTPTEGYYGDMTLRLSVDPAKTAGQGFGSAGQYMDVCIKFDTEALNGYGVRIIRTKEASDGVMFVLVQYDHGKVRYLSREVLTSCYRTRCEITLSAKENRLAVHGESKSVHGKFNVVDSAPDMAGISRESRRYAAVVDLSAEIEENLCGGTAIWHTGTPGTGGWQNTTMLHYLEVSAQVF